MTDQSGITNLGVDVVEGKRTIPASEPPKQMIGRSGTHRSRGQWFTDVGWRYIVTVLALIFALFPIAWAVSGAFSSGGLSAQKLIPENPTLDNLRTLMTAPAHPPF